MTAAFWLVPVNVASAFTAGVVLALVGGLKQPLAHRLGTAEDRIGALSAWQQLALVLSLPFAGVAVDRLGVEQVLIVSSLLTGAGCALLVLRESFALARFAVLVLGMAAAGLLTGTVVLLPTTFPTRHPAAAVNLGLVAMGLGLVLAPWLLDLLQERLRLRRALLLTALACLTPALTAALTPGDEWPAPLPAVDWHLALSNQFIWLAALDFIFYVPLEATLTTWANRYLVELGMSERQVRWQMTGFWLTFLVARGLMAALIISGALSASALPWIILGLALAAGVGLGNLVGTGHRASAGWGLLVVGFFCGPLLPTLLGILLAKEPQEPGTAVGMTYALGALSSLLLTPVAALLARRSGAQRALRIPLLAALLLAGAALLLSLLK